ncbi:MAG TPA: BON domain-containing protein [Vicinamibacterales bacterium]|nr:BON domain-containing protein [Vicinamibacterales bacterium]
MKKVISVLFVSLFTLGTVPALASTSATASADRQKPERKDLQVFNDIAGQVNRYTQLTIFDSISASVDDGRVVLTGWVTMPYKRDDIERRVRKVDGVATIDNKIGVLPVSQFDNELRFRIARAIYGHSLFWNYANMVNPPIRIVVNRGRVTLEGVVQSNVERQLARSLAAGFGEFELKNALKTDAEVREEMERKSN